MSPSTSADSKAERWAQIATWPNAFTLLRLMCIPVFLWLVFGEENRGGAAWLLAALGATDWVDGWLARRLDQMTDFGAAFDPIVDRLLFVVAVPSLMVLSSIPIFVAILALAREAVTVLLAVVAAVRGPSRIDVTWEGKTGAFLLMFAIPMFLGATSDLSYAPVLAWLAWLFAVPGLVYGWFATIFQYLPHVRGGNREATS